jgi:hypothetical protein
VDMRFLTNHWIHQSGGIPFFAVALTMFIPLVWLLRKSEGRRKTGSSGQWAAGSEPEHVPRPLAAGSGKTVC